MLFCKLNRKVLWIISLLCVIVLSICACTSTNNEDGATTNESASSANETEAKSESISVEEEFTLFKKLSNCTVYQRNSGFNYYKIEIFGLDGSTLGELETHGEPEISEICYESDKVLAVRFSAGTDVSTNCAVFYNLTTGNVSEKFVYCLDISDDGLVAVGTRNSVIVQDIFDSSKYCAELTQFEEAIPENLANIFTAEFSSDGNKLSVTYRIGPKEHKTEVFDLR